MIALESVIGEDEVQKELVANEDMLYQLFETCVVTPVGTVLRPDTVRATHDNMRHAYVKNGSTVEITGYLTGKADGLGTAPDFRSLLIASNLKETLNAGVSSVYNTQTDRQGTLSVTRHHHEVDSTQSRLVKTTGVVGNISFSFTANDFAKYSFSGTGISFNQPSDRLQYFDDSTGQPILDNEGAALTYTGTAAYSDKFPIVCKEMTVTVNGVTYNVSDIQLDCAWNTGTLDTVNGPTTYYQVFNTRGGDAPVTGTLTLVSGQADYDDFLARWPAGTVSPMVLEVTDGVDTIRFDMPQSALGAPSNGDVNGLQSYQIPFFATVNSTAGNDSLTITFT
jgi:hypothetical protein